MDTEGTQVVLYNLVRSRYLEETSENESIEATISAGRASSLLPSKNQASDFDSYK